MSPLARLMLFFVALGAAFGGAVALGHAVGPIDRGGKTEAHGSSAMEMAPAGPAGLSIADHGLRLEPSRTTLAPGRAQSFSFLITNADGQPLRSYDVTHEKRMHLIVVRRDLTGFHHIHPVVQGERWVARIPALQPGSYRAFADFSTGGETTVLGVDLALAGSFTPSPLPRSHQAATPDGYIVSLDPGGPFASGKETTVSFHVTRNGRTAAVGRYLGARGHLVILRAGDLAYLHTHADENSLQFGATFPSAGRYRAFLQFSAGGSVHTAPFTIEVDR
ncbi:MAG: hypothetical protein H0W90_05245 [Actinobacteria bacterium]|nr:hypothetical protein [Actinomycetota bacterium]